VEAATALVSTARSRMAMSAQVLTATTRSCMALAVASAVVFDPTEITLEKIERVAQDPP